MSRSEFPRLKIGDRFRHHGGDPTVWEVMRVTDCSATVRPLATRHTQIRNRAGEVVASFDAPGGRIQISPHSSVVPVQGGSEEESPRLPAGNRQEVEDVVSQ